MQWDSASSEEGWDLSDYAAIGEEEEEESEWGKEVWEDWDSSEGEDQFEGDKLTKGEE